MASSEPRGHHTLPRFYQAGFANERDQIRVVDRVSGAEYTTNVANVAQRRDWNAFEDDEGNRRQEVEKLLGDVIDGPAANAFRILRAGEFPFEDEEDRAAVARFVAAQLTRGVGQRENVSEFLREIGSLTLKAAAHNAPDQWWQSVAGEVPSEEARERLKTQEGFEIQPSRAFLLQTLLSSIEEVARVVFLRSWSLLTFDQAWLFTSEDPVVLAGPRDMPLGVGTANEVHLPVSPSAAFVMSHPEPHWEDRLAEGSEVVASRLNTWHIASSPSERLLVHPAGQHHPLDPEVPQEVTGALLRAISDQPA